MPSRGTFAFSPTPVLMSLPRRIAFATALVLVARPLVAQAPEGLWYATNAETSVQSFLAHADRIAIVAPQAFALDSTGVVTGRIDPRIVAKAREANVKLVPLIVNPSFDQAVFHRVLVTATARANAVRNITALCRDNRFHGIQFDFENIAVTDRDALTAFSREVADSLHAIGCSISAAVVPRSSEDRGPTAYHQWMFDNWRGAYDFKALADAMDYLSLMTYSQHTRRTPPGPVAGYPWMEAAVKYLLSLGVAPARISLGLPAYSQRWSTAYDAQAGARVAGNSLTFLAASGWLTKSGVQPTWDPRQKEAYAFWENDGLFEWIFLQDARAFDARLGLMRQYGLRGYSVWVLGQEDPKVWELPGVR
ncbi:MAG: hypothetical protein H0W68_01740 [Gemmatimonadaceae bacterium]|nr:hypothetical protein [Gemmatimonadaceae bacterium]